jgi:hypothetical protein
MARWLKNLLVPAVLVTGWIAFVVHSRMAFPPENTPEGAYARIVLAVTSGRPRDCFAYLETQSQWASYTIRDFRSKAAARVAESYPEPDRSALLSAYEHEAKAPDGADVWAWFAQSRGFVVRLRKDLSGIRRVEIAGERATVETARGTRYAFRRRENGIWGLTIFTAELMAEAQKAARDWEVVRRAADDYARAGAAAGARHQ